MSRLAARRLNIKQRLERIFARDLRRVYSDEARQIAESIETGIPTDRFHNEQKLKTIIGAHLNRISKTIEKTEFTEAAQKEYNRIMSSKMYDDLVNSFNKLANAIIKKDIKEKSKLSIGEQHVCLDVNFKEEEEKKKVGWLYWMMLAIPARSLLISNLETQEVYEANSLIDSVKEDETIIPQIVGVAIATGTIYSLLSPAKKRKIWRSIKIPTTRDTHASADGQEVGLNEPFIVGGEELMYPGDSRTASPENYINCYCTVEYVTK